VTKQHGVFFFSPHILMEFGYLHLCSGRIVSQTWISYIIYIM